MEQHTAGSGECGTSPRDGHPSPQPRLGDSGSGHVSTVMPRRTKAQARSPMPSSIRVEDVRPSVDCGDESAKRCRGDDVRVSATVIAHGTKVVRAAVRFKAAGAEEWNRAPMREIDDEPD